MPSSVDHQTQAQSLKAILAELSEAELIELIPQLAELLRRTGTEYWWMKKNVFDAFEAHGFHVTQDHFYSPQPTVASLAPDLWEGPRYLNPAFAFDVDGMRALFEELAPFASELADVPVRGTAGFYWDNNFRSGDILFVDTSHVFKLGNDLHHLLFHVLPALPAVVFVHFHDIFLPREYPPEWVVGRNWLWNEQYLLLAFLMYKQSVPCSLYEPPLSVHLSRGRGERPRRTWSRTPAGHIDVDLQRAFRESFQARCSTRGQFCCEETNVAITHAIHW